MFTKNSADAQKNDLNNSTKYSGENLPPLDGLRGMMAVGVISSHLGAHYFPGAMLIMDIFFLLSGFLITGILYRSYEKTGSLQLKKFWWRRIRRLCPALYTLLAIYAVVVSILQGNTDGVAKDVFVTASYTMNWVRAHDFSACFNLGHTWSLGVEEQFYILWPILLSLLMRLRVDKKKLMIILISFAVINQCWKWFLIFDNVTFTRIYHSLDTRLDGFCLGAAVYFFTQIKKTIIPRWMGWVSLLIISATLLGPKGFDVSIFIYMQPIVTWSTVILLLSFIDRPKTGVSRCFTNQVQIFLGKICYSLYIWHLPILFVSARFWPMPPMVRIPVMLTIVLIVSTISHYLVEKPFLKKRY